MAFSYRPHHPYPEVLRWRQSKLPDEDLGRVWELADFAQDGLLDEDEFCIAMRLMYDRLKGCKIPAKLDPKLVPKNRRYILQHLPGTRGDNPFLSDTDLWIFYPFLL